MRMLLALALLSGGCSSLLGIADPVASGDGGVDAQPGDGSVIDGPPPCIAPPGFAAPESYTLSGTPGLMATGDFDRDTNQDVAIALGTKVLILHGDGKGKLERPQELATAADGVIGEDFDSNGDGIDLILWTVGGASVVERRQDPAMKGSFLPEQPLGTFTGVRQVKVGFLDGAFVPDLSVQDDVELRVYTSNQGTRGTFSKGPTIGGTGDQLLAIKNLIGLDDDDIALVTPGGDLEIAPQDNGSFGTPVPIVTGTSGFGAGFGELDGDPAPDLIVATPSGGVVYRQTAGAGPSFVRVPGVVAGVTGPTLQVIDVDHDGHDDLVVAAGIVQQCAPGVFSALVPLPITGATLLRDLNKNGKPDLLRIVGSTLEVRIQ
jgi:VCBS repeat protein